MVTGFPMGFPQQGDREDEKTENKPRNYQFYQDCLGKLNQIDISLGTSWDRWDQGLQIESMGRRAEGSTCSGVRSGSL